jgi:trehalose 6-phosphate phosphatase
VAVPRALTPFVAAADRSVLLLDFDGSVAPIVRNPAAARVLPAARTALARLVPFVGRVALVSGRPAGFLLDALALEGIDYVGAYGLERVVDGEVVVDDRALPYVDAVARAGDEAEAALPGLRVERKGVVAVTLHWREQPARGPEATAWAEAAAARLGLDAPVRGRMAVELRPPVAVDKGTVTTALARGAAVAAFAGDDSGDLPAFAALRALAEAGDVGTGLTIGVASEEGPPEIRTADVVVEGPAGLADLLAAVGDELSARAR